MEHLPTTTYHYRSYSAQQQNEKLNRRNKFKHKLGPGGYKAAIPVWTKKEQEPREVGILDLFEVCTLCMKNWIQGRSHTDDTG
jgi:hypothetical protein